MLYNQIFGWQEEFGVNFDQDMSYVHIKYFLNTVIVGL